MRDTPTSNSAPYYTHTHTTAAVDLEGTPTSKLKSVLPPPRARHPKSVLRFLGRRRRTPSHTRHERRGSPAEKRPSWTRRFKAAASGRQAGRPVAGHAMISQHFNCAAPVRLFHTHTAHVSRLGSTPVRSCYRPRTRKSSETTCSPSRRTFALLCGLLRNTTVYRVTSTES